MDEQQGKGKHNPAFPSGRHGHPPRGGDGGAGHAPGGLRVSTDPHGGNLAVCRGCVAGLADGEVEEREQAEDVGEGGVEPVVVCRVVIADVVELGDCGGLLAARAQNRRTTDFVLRQPGTAG